MRRQGIGVGRTDNTATVERKEGGQEAPVTLKVVLRHALDNASVKVELHELMVSKVPFTTQTITG